MEKMKRTLLKFALLLLAAGSVQADNLYQGEQRIDVQGYPAVTRYFAGDPAKPLIVFSPGAHHNARISYGGHPGGRQEDFLAYWLNKLGYNFLAVSYPIATAGAFMDAKAAPDFSAQKWGEQVAAAAKAASTTHNLSGHVVLLNWSMAGKVIQPAYKAVSAAGLTVDGAISLAATPGIIGTINKLELKKSPAGYADRTASYGGWLRQIKVNNEANGREIIPEAVYRADYVGDIPVGLEGFGEVYRNGKFEFDFLAQAIDYGAVDFANQPLIGILINDGAADPEHSLVDRYWWGIYNAETLYHRLRKAGIDFSTISQPQWARIRALSAKIGDELAIPVSGNGNHFSFVGEKGASTAAKAVDQAIQRLVELNKELASIK